MKSILIQHLFLVFLQLYICSVCVIESLDDHQNAFEKFHRVAQLLRCPQTCQQPCDRDSMQRNYLLHQKDWKNLAVASSNSSESASKSSSLSSVSLYTVLHLSRTVCKSDNTASHCLPSDTYCQISSLSQLVCQQAAQPTTQQGKATPQTIQHVLSTINPILQHNNCTKYFDSYDVLLDIGNRPGCEDANIISDISTSILTKIINGQCIGNSTDGLDTEDIFRRYGKAADNLVIDEYGLKQLLNDLWIKRDAASENGSKCRKGRSVEQLDTNAVQLEQNGHNHSNSRPTEEYLDSMFQYDVDNSNTIDLTEFLKLCPHIVNILTHYEGNTINATTTDIMKQPGNGQSRHSEGSSQDGGDNQAMAYGLGTVAVLIISLGSVLGFFVMPCLSARIYEYAMAFFIALAYGTLFGDGILHLLPEALGLDALVVDDTKMPPHFWKLFALMMICYGLFVLETLSEYFVEKQSSKGESNHSNNTQQHGHGHSHVPNRDILQNFPPDTKTLAVEAPGENGPNEQSSSNVPQRKNSIIGGRTIFGLTALAWMIILGDGIHNIADGLAVGAAFSTSTNSGLATSLAVLFHEIPHELGDFAILISTGLSFKKALLLNFASAITAFVGLYIGVAVGSDEAVTQWIFIVTAAIFITVAMGNMLPEMKNFRTENKGQVMIAMNLGALLGMATMTLLAVYEGSINFD